MTRSAVDLFCGCGGLSHGLAAADFDVVAGFDSWKPAMVVYELNNIGHDCHLFDLSDLQGAIEKVRSYKPFLIAGGPPCQDFSSAGDRTEGVRADLTVKFARIVADVKPQTFIMENVSRAAISEAYKTATEIFKEAGYGITLKLLDASLCGVPQKRKRLFMVGMLGEQDGFLDATIKENLGTKPLSIRDHLGEALGIEHYYRHPRTYARRAIYSIDEPSPTIRGVNRPMPANYNKHANDAADPDPAVVRAMTTEERALIQTFPHTYMWPSTVTKGNKDQMIGNAVPVKLAEFVANALYQYLDVKMPDVPEWQPADDFAEPIAALIAAE